jgi:hypothetical protein
MVSDLGGEAGLDELEKEATKRAKAAKPEAFKSKESMEDDDGEEDEGYVHLSLSANYCSDPELVRKHLDSGVLAKLVAKKQKKVDALGTKPLDIFDPRYELVLLGACAMSLGCTLPPSFKDHLKKNYKSVGLMRDAVKQMDKALNGPDGFTDGKPYEFDSPGLLETVNRGGPPEEDLMYPGGNGGFRMLNVQAPFGLPPLSDQALQDIRDEVQEGKHGDDACGGCGAKEGENGSALQSCSKCKKRKYCSKECQKGHWKLHKKVCQVPEEGKENVEA